MSHPDSVDRVSALWSGLLDAHGFLGPTVLRADETLAIVIDKKFTEILAEDPTDSPVDASIVKAIITLARGMNLMVMAQGIETPHQRALLTRLGCHEGRGCLLGRPGPPEGVPA